MKIGYMVIGMLLICCATILVCADHEDIKNVAALSLSASPGASFALPSTPPISMISPYRDHAVENAIECFPKLTEADRRKLSKKNTSASITNYESNYIFEKAPVVKKDPKVSMLKGVLKGPVIEEIKEGPLSASVDSNGLEAAFHIDDEYYPSSSSFTFETVPVAKNIPNTNKSIIDKGMKPKIFVTDDGVQK